MSSDTPEPTPAEALNETLTLLSASVRAALPDICADAVVFGTEYNGFLPDPSTESDALDDTECDHDSACSQVWVRVADVSIRQVESYEDGCSAQMVVQVEVGVSRCLGVGEHEQAYTEIEMTGASMQAMDDMKAIYCTVLNLRDDDGEPPWEGLEIGNWAPLGPAGGLYGGSWMFTLVGSW